MTSRGEAQSPSTVYVIGPSSPALRSELQWGLESTRMWVNRAPAASAPDHAFAAGAIAVLLVQEHQVTLILADGRRASAPNRPGEERTLARWTREMVSRVRWQPPPRDQVSGPRPPRFSWSQFRRRQRGERPWRLRLAFGPSAAPRAINGFGPYDDDDGMWAYPGITFRPTLQRYFTSFVRLDLVVGLGYVFGDSLLDANHGVEGTLGAHLLLLGPWRASVGGGIGIEGLLAREYDAAENSHFGWLGFRLLFPVEINWVSKSLRGFAIQVTPTVTCVPYQSTWAPGVVSTLGLDIGL